MSYKIYQPMKYATARNKEVLDAALESDNYLIQLKKDGSSYVLAKDSDGSVHLYGDKISKKTGQIIDKIENVPHLKAWAEENLPQESQLVVEICYGKTSRDVNSIMLALPDKAILRQTATQLAKAYIFDILFWNGEEVFKEDYADRWKRVCDEITDLPQPAFIELAETHFTDKAEWLARWLKAGEEGGVLKMLRSTTKTSAMHHVRPIGATVARPANTTFKVKQIDTIDAVIMGVTLPEKEYKGKDPENYQYRDEKGNPVNRLWALGMVNAFSIGAYDDNGELVQIGTVASGLDDELRLAAAADPDRYIGEVVEIACMSKDTDNCTLRHPRLICFRPDKAAEQCTLKEAFR